MAVRGGFLSVGFRSNMERKRTFEGSYRWGAAEWSAYPSVTHCGRTPPGGGYLPAFPAVVEPVVCDDVVFAAPAFCGTAMASITSKRTASWAVFRTALAS